MLFQIPNDVLRDVELVHKHFGERHRPAIATTDQFRNPSMVSAHRPRRHVLFGLGSISSAEDAYEAIRLGASLVQLYTALVYRGLALVRQINPGLCRLLERDDLRNISEAVGSTNGGAPRAS